MSVNLIEGIFIPLKIGNYNYTNIITQIDPTQLGISILQLQALNQADPTIKDATGNSIDVDDIFTIEEDTNKRYYSQKSKATKNLIDLPILKDKELKNLRNDYETIYQRAILIDGINFVLELYGDNFDLLQNVSAKGLRGTKRVYVKVFKINQDLSLSPRRARVPNIFSNEIFNILNDYSVNNYDVYDYYKEIINKISDIDSFAITYQINDYFTNNIIQEGIFTKNITIDIDNLIDNLSQKTDIEFLNLKYHQIDIDDFRNWYIEIQDNKVNNKYQIF